MKTLILTLLTFFAITANAQTADVTTTTTNNTEATTTDMTIFVPMMGNINLKNCDEKMQEDLKPLSEMNVIKIDDAIYYYIDEEETILALYIQEEKEIEMPLQ
jgi:hypothetical protein